MFHPDPTEEEQKAHETRHYKPRRKKRLKGLPNKVVVLKNIDKDVGNWVESWDYPKTRSPGCIIHPFRILALGNVSRGKTNSLKNIFLKHQSSAKKFKHLYVITCSLDSQEWADCEPDMILDEIPPLDMFDGAEKTMVVLDDYEFAASNKEQSKRLATLCRFISSHRNVSVMVTKVFSIAPRLLENVPTVSCCTSPIRGKRWKLSPTESVWTKGCCEVCSSTSVKGTLTACLSI